MRSSALEFCVLGVGHLAAAVRVQLRLFGLLPPGHCEGAPGTRRVLLACSDYVSTSSFGDANRRAVDDHCAILFAWLAEGGVGVGPLVIPLESPCFECQPARMRDLSLDDTTPYFVFGPPRATLNPDTHLRSIAQFGALLVARELCRLRSGAPKCLVGRVAKFDPPWPFPERLELARAPACAVCGLGRPRPPAGGRREPGLVTEFDG
jgi:bacteriocin biosynthesis cyclodehydratase domain-containing protein